MKNYKNKQDLTKDRPSYSKETFLVHGKPWDQYWEYGHHAVPPITASTTFRLEHTQRGYEGFLKFNKFPEDEEAPIYIYDRLGEPTIALLENSMAQIEGGQSATAFASGMAAISAALFTLCQSGQEIVAHKTIYGCTYSLMTQWLPRFNIHTRFINMLNLQELERAITGSTRVVYFETPANPTLDIIDIVKVSQLVHQLNQDRVQDEKIWVVVDNTFATPYCQRPLELGADLVVQSLTKDVSGFGTDMGGIVVGPASIHSRIRLVRKDVGGIIAPRACWNILVYGLTSLGIRMKHQMNSALKVAKYLETKNAVRKVLYPGLESHPQYKTARKQMVSFNGKFAPGQMVYFELKGQGQGLLKKTRTFMDYIASHSYTITLAVSLGHVKTLIEAPAVMTHTAYGTGEQAKKAGLSLGGIRLSLGIEDPDDIIADLEQAFNQIE